MENLLQKKCVPCQGGEPPVPVEKILGYLAQAVGWEKLEETTPKGRTHPLIRREFKFQTFKEAVAFANRVAELAEAEGHHPNIHIFYNKVRLDLWTHAINNLHENDFIMAAKINRLTEGGKI